MRKKHHIFPNMIRVNINKVKNNFFVPKMVNSPRFFPNEKFSPVDSLSLKSPRIYSPFMYYSKNQMEGMDKKTIKHYQSRDNLDEQLNMIKFKMSCDIIGQKMNQLQSFMDGMKNKNQQIDKNQINFNTSKKAINKSFNKVCLNENNTIINDYFIKNLRINNKRKRNKSRTGDNNLSNIKKRNKTLNILQSNKFGFLDEYDNNFLSNNFNSNGISSIDKNYNNFDYYIDTTTNVDNLQIEKEIKKKNDNIKYRNLSPFDVYFLNEEEDVTPFYLTQNQNFQNNNIMNDIKSDMNQNKEEDINQNIKATIFTNKKNNEYKIQSINNLFYDKSNKINSFKKKSSKDNNIGNKFRQNLVEEKTVFSILNTETNAQNDNKSKKNNILQIIKQKNINNKEEKNEVENKNINNDVIKNDNKNINSKNENENKQSKNEPIQKKEDTKKNIFKQISDLFNNSPKDSKEKNDNSKTSININIKNKKNYDNDGEQTEEEEEQNEEEKEESTSYKGKVISDKLFALIDQKASEIKKVTEELSKIKEEQEKKEKKEKIQENVSKEKISEKKILNKKNVNFDVENNIIIKYDERELSKKIKIFNTKGKKLIFNAMDLNKYINKIKNKQGLKSSMINYIPKTLDTKKIEEKLALDKLTELLDECDEKPDITPRNKKLNKTSNSIKAKKNYTPSKYKEKKLSKDKANIKKLYNNYFTEDTKKNQENNFNKKKLFSEKIVKDILKKGNSKTKKSNTLNCNEKQLERGERNKKALNQINNKNKAEINKNTKINKAINRLKNSFLNDDKYK